MTANLAGRAGAAQPYRRLTDAPYAHRLGNEPESLLPPPLKATWCLSNGFCFCTPPTAPRILPDDRRQLDFVLYGATRRREALCCDVSLVSPLRAHGRPQPNSRDRDGAAIEVPRRCKLARGGPQRLVCWHPRSVGALAARPTISSAAWSLTLFSTFSLAQVSTSGALLLKVRRATKGEDHRAVLRWRQSWRQPLDGLTHALRL